MGNVTDFCVSLHLKALRSIEVEIGVLDMVKDRMLLRTVQVASVARLLPWLKYQNMQGGNVYVRPKWPHTMTLVDDLSADAVLAMQADGYEPSFLVETSPDNFQAWLDNGEQLEQAVATRVARLIAERFGADEHSADWRHLGRLAGFTNRKAKYRDKNGQFPFVRAHEVIAPRPGYTEAVATKNEAEQQLEMERLEREAKRSSVPVHSVQPRDRALPITRFWRDARYGGDFTRADLAYAVHALGRGLLPQEVRAAIATRDLSHKGSIQRQEAYLDRTLDKAHRFLHR